MERLRIAVEGVVQGVGFRPFVFGLADRLGVRGFVANRAGDVVIEAEAERQLLERFLVELRERAPAAARVDRVTATAVDPRGEAVFAIVHSEAGEGAAAIAPDVATCDDCVAEILDRSSRRHRYAFTSCAACGPRLTIVTAAPYDRARTTMASFALCDACRAEHDDPRDRRFHAQPIACPACGPQLVLVGDDGDPIEVAAALIRAGGIVAIKGLGGYHLACDATNETAVAELRWRKQRDAKPFAVMVADVAAAAALADLDAAARELLASPARPIVLVPRVTSMMMGSQRSGAHETVSQVGAAVALGSRGDCPAGSEAVREPDCRTLAQPLAQPLAASVAPGVADVGLMLPYTPLHHLLLRAVGGPLVMTSGNVSDEPIAYRDDDAQKRLAPIADRFLVHDRAIHMRCEDSVARVVCGAPMILRRARGYAPAPLRLATPLARPTLALGGHLKSAFVLGAGDVAFVSPHFGDLDHPSAYEAFIAALDHFQALHRITPQAVACDLHPDYATTRIAELLRLPRIAVQHHHAHFASALADAGVTGRAIGVIFDGAGYGTDGAIWGGEILVGDAGQVRRAAHLAYVPQPGGDRASVEPWRMAIAHLAAAGAPLELVGADPVEAGRVAALCNRPNLAPPTSSVGRLFDAVAALAGVASYALYEGHAAMKLEALARGRKPSGCYPYVLTDQQLVVAPMIRAIADDVRAHTHPAVIARRFHTTIVELAALACERIATAEGITDVVLSGGVFQNAILAEELPVRLTRAGLVAHHHRHVPPNDGGLALGQLAVAAARGGA